MNSGKSLNKSGIPEWDVLKHTLKMRAEGRAGEVVCAGGEKTSSYLDLKGCFTNGFTMKYIAEAFMNYSRLLWSSPPFNAVGGPTMGADFLSHAIAIKQAHYNVHWFSVRDEPKDHGLQRLIEGVTLAPHHRVLLVDDVVSSGKSLLKAYDAVWDTGAQIVAVMPIVDRAGIAETSFLERGVPYHPLFTHHELGIDPL